LKRVRDKKRRHIKGAGSLGTLLERWRHAERNVTMKMRHSTRRGATPGAGAKNRISNGEHGANSQAGEVRIYTKRTRNSKRRGPEASGERERILHGHTAEKGAMEKPAILEKKSGKALIFRERQYVRKCSDWGSREGSSETSADKRKGNQSLSTVDAGRYAKNLVLLNALGTWSRTPDLKKTR